MTRFLEIRDLSVSYGSDCASGRILHAVNLDIHKGETLGILGESGSGKSTILRAIIKMLASNAHVKGRISFEDRNLLTTEESEMSAIRGAKISMVYQDPIAAFDPVFTVGQQIAETIIRHQGASKRTALMRARDLLDMVQIPMSSHRLNAYPHELSGGMRQRAMIALALCCNPNLLLADEPTSALDLTVQMQIILLLKELQRSLGMAMILVTHDVGVAAELCDKLAVLYSGNVVERGSTVDVILSPRHPYTLNLLEASVVGERRGMRLQVTKGSSSNRENISLGCAFEPRCRYADEQCLKRSPEEYLFEETHLHRCTRVASGEISLSPPIVS